MDIHKKYIDNFTGELQRILLNELALGNSVKESFGGNWSYPNVTAIILSKPFITPINRKLEGIIFRNINDPRYWKAEYCDEQKGLLLACSFNDIPDFTPM